MSATLMGESPNSPEATGTDKERSYVRRFKVQTTSFADDALVVLNAVGVPRPFDPYITLTGSDLAARCREAKAARLADNSLWWEVECTYKTPEKEEDDDENENPLLEMPECRGEGESYRVPAQGTANDESEFGPAFEHCFKSSAGEPFVPQPEKDDGWQNLSITINKDINYPIIATIREYQNKVNSDVFFGQPAGTCKIMKPSWNVHYKDKPNGQKIDYIRVTWNFQIKETWEIQLLDHGTYYIPDDGPLAGEKVSFKNEDGQPRIGLLDGAGDALPDGGEPEFLGPYKLYKTKAFAGLNLPQSPAQCKKHAR